MLFRLQFRRRMYHRACERFILAVALLVTTARPGRDGVGATMNDAVWTLRNVLVAESWVSGAAGNLRHQGFYVDGQLTTLDTIVGGKRTVDENNADEVSSAMYMALECRCGAALRDALGKRVTSPDSRVFATVNQTLLKVASALLDLTDVAPNVASHGPGLLAVCLSLNLEANRAAAAGADGTDVVERTVRYMMNAVERFTTMKCPLDGGGGGGGDHSAGLILHGLNDELDNSGLLTTIVSDFADAAADSDPPEESGDFVNFVTIVVRVVEKLSSVLDVESSSFVNKIADPRNDIDDILLYMDTIFDSLTRIVCSMLLVALDDVEDGQDSKNAKMFEILLKTWQDSDLLKFYSEAVLSLHLLKFPRRFTTHVEQVLKMMRDVPRYKNMFDLLSVKKQIKEHINFIDRKKRTGRILRLNKTKRKQSLSKIIATILSIDEFKYFNLIYTLQQNYDILEYDSTEMTLNKMKYVQVYLQNSKTEQICKIMRSMYAFSFDIESRINNCQSKWECLLKLKENFWCFWNVMNDIGKSFRPEETYENLKIILSLLNRFLHRSIIIFPRDGLKIKRVLYWTVNLLDKYQMHSCDPPEYHDTVYLSYNTPAAIENDMKLWDGEKYQMVIDNETPLIDFDKNNYTEKNVVDLLQKNYVFSFYEDPRRSISFYWKGEVKSFNDIYDDLITNAFELSTFTKYVNIFHKWIVSVLFYTIHEILKYFTKCNSYDKERAMKFKESILNLQQINLPAYFHQVINTFSITENFNQPVVLYGHQILLKDHLDQFNVVQKLAPFPEDIDYYIGQLTKLYHKLMGKFNGVHIVSSASDETNIRNEIKFDKEHCDKINSNIVLSVINQTDNNNSNKLKNVSSKKEIVSTSEETPVKKSFLNKVKSLNPKKRFFSKSKSSG